MHDIPQLTLMEADQLAANGSVNGALNVLRQLSLENFGELLFHLPDARYPNLSKVLPHMASVQVQRDWTGADGMNLLNQTLLFTRAMASLGIDLSNSRILDFGCGYGRILRTMYYYANPDVLYGCDPWDESLELCRDAGILGHLAVSDYLPQHLPFEGKFDLLYAYSVFTHLSERATGQCLNTLAAACNPNGTIAITIRPEDYWQHSPGLTESGEFLAAHRINGFAFNPHLRAPIDGDLTYGDTSMTTQWIERQFPALKIVSTMPTSDPLQTLVVLKLR